MGNIPFINDINVIAGNFTLNGSGTYAEGINSTSGQAFKLEMDLSGNGALTLANTSGTAQVFFTGAGGDNYILGDVGIGTTSPSFGTGGGLQITNATQANLRFTDTSASTFITDLALSNDDFYIINRAASGQLKFRVNASTEAMTIDSNGNVGIGTTSPTFQLHVNSAVNGATAIGVSNTGSGASRVYLDASNGDFSGSDYMWIGQNNDLSGEIFMAQSSGSFNFKSQPGGTAQTNLTITQAGNVGIGTTNPGGKLEVDGTYGDLIIGDPSVGTQITYYDTTRIYMNSADIKFYTNSLTERMTIESNGNVGIGTTGPTALLEVKKDNATIYDATSDSGQDDNTATVLVSNDNVTTNTFSQIAFHNKGSNRGISRIVSIGVASASTDLAFVTESSNTKAEKMRISSAGAIKFNTYGAGTLVSDASGNITVSSGGGAGGPYLPLAAGSSYPLTGDLTISKSTPKLIFDNLAGGGLDPTLTASGTNFTISTSSITPLTIALDTGNATFTGRILSTRAPGANHGDPTVAFGDGNTGFYERSDNDLRVSIGGSGVWEFSANCLGSVSEGKAHFNNETATATNPSIIPWRNDADTGIGRSSANVLSLIAGGTEALSLTTTTATFAGGISMSDSILIDYTGSDGQGIDAGVKVMNDASDWGMYVRKDSSADYGIRIDSGGANAFNIYSTTGGSTKTFGVNGSTGDATSVGKIIIADGTTSVQSTDKLYIGGSGLASADAAIYMGNQGAGGGYGYRIYYSGTGSGNDNKLILKSENIGTEVDMLTFTADGNATFAGNVGIGMTAGTIPTEIEGRASDGKSLRLWDNAGTDILDLYNNGTNAYINTTHSGGAGNPLIIQTNSITALTLNTSQNATFAGNVSLEDNKELIFGAATDFKIYHNSTTNVNHVSSQIDRQLSINGNIIQLTNQANSTTYLKLESTGATFAGNVTVGDDIIIEGNQLTFKSVAAAFIDHNTVGNSIKFRLSSSSSLDVIPLEITPGYVAFLDVPIVGTMTAGNNTTRAASTAFVTSAVATGVGNYLPLAGGTLTGALTGTSANFTSTVVVDNMLTIDIDDISSGENRGLNLLNSNGTDQQWNLTAGQTGVDNDKFTIRDSTYNINALTIAVNGGEALFAGNVVATNILEVAGVATGSPYLHFTQAGTQKAYIQYQDSGDSFELQSDNQFVVRTGGSTTAFTINSSQNATFAGKAYGVTPIASDTDVMLATKGYVNQQISGGATYLGVWDPDKTLNSGYGNPSLQASGRTDDSGDYFICSADGIAEPNGSTAPGPEPNSWHTGDWVIWNQDLNSGNGQWQKIDNTTVLSGGGTTGTIPIFTNSETIGDSIITVSSGTVDISGSLDINQTGDTNGIKIYGYDDRSAYSGDIYIDSSGNFRINQTHGAGSGYIQIQGESYLSLDAASLVYTSSVFRIYDSGRLDFGNDGDYRIQHNEAVGVDNLTIHTNNGDGIAIDNAGNVGIGTDSPKANLDITNGAGKFCVDSKTHNVTNAFTTCLTVNLNSHTGCYVTLTCFGDWGSHSAAAYKGEFFLQNGANSYNEPGIILRQDDNTSNGTDQIVCQLLDPTGTGNPKDFEIQIRTTATSGTTSFAGQLTYTVQGKFNSIT